MNIFNNDNNVVSLGILFVLLILLVYVIIRNYVSGKFIENFVDDANIFKGDSVKELNLSNSVIGKFGDSYDTSFNSLIADKRNEILNNELVQIDNVNNMIRRNNNTLKKLKDNIDKNKSADKYPTNEPIKTIKSKYNSQVLSVIHQDNKYYKIQINDKCLSVYDDNKYKLTECVVGETNFPVQLFYQELINNASDIKRVYGEYPGVNMNYPFSVFKSAITDQFLTSSDMGITVEPGIPNDVRQQWLISPMAYNCQ